MIRLLRRPGPAPAVAAALLTLLSGCATVGSVVERGCTVEPGLATMQQRVAGLDYSAQVYQPDGLTGRRPVVVDFHGLGDTAEGQAAGSRFRELADEEGFAVVNPTGQRGAFGARGWELSMLDQPGRDDVAYVAALVESLVAEQCADPDRVYLAGFSNGGFLVSELGCRLAGRVAAVAAVAGTTWIDGCRPADPVPMVVFHGTADRVVPYTGSTDSLLLAAGGSDGWARLLTQSVPAEVAQAARARGCAPAPRRRSVAPGVQRSTYLGCDRNAEVVFYRVSGGVHAWPGASDRPGWSVGGLDATEVIWDFFERHRTR